MADYRSHQCTIWSNCFISSCIRAHSRRQLPQSHRQKMRIEYSVKSSPAIRHPHSIRPSISLLNLHLCTYARYEKEMPGREERICFILSGWVAPTTNIRLSGVPRLQPLNHLFIQRESCCFILNELKIAAAGIGRMRKYDDPFILELQEGLH